MKRIFCFLILLLICSAGINAQTISQFRGPERNGIYPEKNLLASWPEAGPAISWKAEGIGDGYSSPIISGNYIYVTGEVDSIGYLSVFDKKGKLAWKKEIGREWMENFVGSRSTPTLVGDLVYLCSSMGKISCLEAATGKEKWSVDMLRDLHGINVRFGYSSGLLVDGDVIYCNPGGVDTNMVALNRYTGKIIWKSKALGDSTAYGSPVLLNLPSRKVLVNMTIHNMIGLDATTGELLWSKPQSAERDIQACTPLFEDGFLYNVNGSGSGAVKYEISADGKTIKSLWENPKVTDVHGGFVKLGNYLYTSQYRPRRYCSVDCSNGQVADSLKFDKGAIISADGMLYLYTEKGMVGLVKPDNGKMQLISSFKMPVGTKEFFTIPVIENGILYLRHGDTLLAYDIRRQ
ncbi:MAG: PQQ-binding-like beta-propeller repeat protein [Bacteroidetes bacterium]|nr:PQQ-binding-like beta-propeller repeat protein [Bacteroidota bacterium]